MPKAAATSAPAVPAHDGGIVESVKEAVGQWRQTFAEADVSRADLAILATCIYPAR